MYVYDLLKPRDSTAATTILTSKFPNLGSTSEKKPFRIFGSTSEKPFPEVFLIGTVRLPYDRVSLHQDTVPLKDGETP